MARIKLGSKTRVEARIDQDNVSDNSGNDSEMDYLQLRDRQDRLHGKGMRVQNDPRW
jgi:hypothetical protein